MENIVIRDECDLKKINSDTNAIGFVEFERWEEIIVNNIKNLSFTRMTVDLRVVKDDIKSLNLYSCNFWLEDIKRFRCLEELTITNCLIETNNFIFIESLKRLNLDFCTIEDGEILKGFDNLESLSLIGTEIEDYGFLRDIDNLKEVIVDVKTYEDNKELFKSLEEKNIMIFDMYGGVFNEI